MTDRQDIRLTIPFGINVTIIISDPELLQGEGDTFKPLYITKQAPIGTSQYSTSPTYRSADTIDDQTYGTSLPQGAIQKFQELQRLVGKYSQYCPDGLLQWIIISCVNGDNQLLDDKLEQLRIIDRRLNGWS